jgi:predicted kinase
MMNWKFPYYNVGAGIDWESIEQEFDWFRDMADVPQDKVWHAEGNVQIHTKMVCEAVIKLPEFELLSNQDKHIMVTACLMHDIEKRSTTKEDFKDGRTCIVAPRHADKGEVTARTILYKDIPTPYDIREAICKIVRYHGIPLWSSTEDESEYRVIQSSVMVRNDFLAMIATADILGRICDDNDEQLEKIELFEMLCRDMDCWDKPRPFEAALPRHKYLLDKGYVDFIPYDDSKFEVFVMAGLPASGKDYYIKNNLSHLPMVSIDEIRREHGFKPTDKKGNGKAIQMTKELAKTYMRSRTDFVFNATNISTDMRTKWIGEFKAYKAKVTIVYMEAPYKELLRRNLNREYPVPEKVINKMINKIEIPSYTEAEEIITIAYE